MGDILFLAHRVPFPPDRGDKIRAFNILSYLAQRKRVHLVAFADDPADLKRKGGLNKITGNRQIVWRGKGQATAGVQALVQRRPFSLTAFDNPELRQAVENVLARHSIDTIYVFSSQMAQYLPHKPRQRVVMDFVDMDSAKFAAYGKTTGGFSGWMMRREARMLAQYEKAVAAKADASLFVSEAEAALFRERTRAQRVHAVENGIDTATFDPDAPFRRLEAVAPLLVFTGQMDYRPNVEGVTWFAESVFPHIRLRHPDAQFAIVGRKPDAAVQALAKIPGVTVTGEVPDVRPWVAAASVVVAPLKLARGVQNKVLEAMAMARPVVASAAAATGIDHGDTIEVAEGVGGMADAVNALLDDPVRAAELGRAARQQVIGHYSWEAKLAVLDGIMGFKGLRDPQPRRKVAAA
ncbi:TIGR03087 family PEP-CTERM/XrtA system glycosyltransferase [Sphingomonas sp. MS122]|uniref:TIGR03087 family PEP-CTERM/XrtA system glycosyltransferase n=1 Tax=Sphingomonas sp. MS122 TaxID=3412683 RepID=UPI003C2C9AFB